ncbi:MAG: flagellar basal body rod protein FlgB [Lentisphaerae bacterium]|nr:flagellar basal body rod protein FlgB [Lentisphaerota bacterium]
MPKDGKLRIAAADGMEHAFVLSRMDTSITLLNKLLDLTAARHEVLANNLANVNTPGVTRQDLRFKDSLISAIKSDDKDAISSLKAELYDDVSQPFRPDGNNITTQSELAEMSQNELMYRVASRALSMKYSGMRKVLSGQF